MQTLGLCLLVVKADIKMHISMNSVSDIANQFMLSIQTKVQVLPKVLNGVLHLCRGEGPHRTVAGCW